MAPDVSKVQGAPANDDCQCDQRLDLEELSDLPTAKPAKFDPPDPKAFHGLFGEIVKVLEPHTEADPVALLAQLLVGFGNLIGRSAHFKVGGDTHYFNLYTVLIGDTSLGGKGMSWGRARSVLAEADAEWCAKNVGSGAASGEGLIYAVRDDRLDDDGNLIVAGVPDKRLLLLETEWGRVMTVAAREGNTIGPILRSFWDSGDNRSFKVEKPYYCTNAHISIIGHVTGAEITSRLTSAEKCNGGANRILWLKVRRTKLLPYGGESSPAGLDKLVSRLKAAADAAKSTGEIDMDSQAKAAWPRLYFQLAGPRPGDAGVMLARGAPIVRRLACIYSLADKLTMVRLADLEAAMALWEYATRSVCNVFGASTANPDADKILGALAKAPNGLSRTEIMVNVFQKNVTKERITAALTLLRDSDFAHARRKRTAGAPVLRWYAGPWRDTN